MESSTPSLSIESFSQNWLVNLKPPTAVNGGADDRSSCGTSFDAADEASFIEMDPKMPSSRRFSRVPKDFSFDFRTSEYPPVTLADADDLISADGVLVPLFHREIRRLEAAAAAAPTSPPQQPKESVSVQDLITKEKHSSGSSRGRVRCSSLRRCKRLSERIFQKYIDFLRPICQKLRRGGGPRTSRVASETYEHQEGRRSCMEFYSPATSPRTSVAWSVDNWRRSCDSESSIYEAVLHCKRTHGN